MTEKTASTISFKIFKPWHNLHLHGGNLHRQALFAEAGLQRAGHGVVGREQADLRAHPEGGRLVEDVVDQKVGQTDVDVLDVDVDPL